MQSKSHTHGHVRAHAVLELVQERVQLSVGGVVGVRRRALQADEDELEVRVHHLHAALGEALLGVALGDVLVREEPLDVGGEGLLLLRHSM